MAEMKFYYKGKWMDRDQMRVARGLQKAPAKRKADLSTDSIRAKRELEERQESEDAMLNALETEVKVQTEVAEAPVEDEKGDSGANTPEGNLNASEEASEPILKSPDEMTYQELIAALKTANKMPDKNPKKEEAIKILKGE